MTSRLRGVPLALALTASLALAAHADSTLQIARLRTEYKTNPLGIDVRKPRFCWSLKATERGAMQSAYQIRVARTQEALRNGKNLLWDSGKTDSSESLHRVYAGSPLQSRMRYVWQVRVWDGRGEASEWSKPAFWEMGLLEPSDWKVDWVEPDLQEDVTKPGPAPLLRREFSLKGAVAQARAYVTSRGLYELQLNGKRVGDEFLTPGWTAYNKRFQYQTYDITKMLRKGENAVGAALGSGWYRGEMGFSGQRNVYGSRLALLCQIHVTYRDGSEETFGTDTRWKSAFGPILMSEIYHGETYDARLEKSGWALAGYTDGAWAGVKRASYPKDNLIAPQGPPVRRIETLKPIRIFKTPAGDTVVDMGQNMVGWLRLKVRGEAGAKVRLRHAEVLDKAGNFYIENLRVAKQTLQYTLKGGDEEVFEPHFTFQGFRYVAVDGYPGELTKESLTGVVVHSDMEPASSFETSNPLINQLQHNIRWGQKGNFVDVPTDCPQRDERLGWTGDAQAFAPTATFNMDVAGFFTKWLKDVAADQLPSGSVPFVIPNVLGPGSAGATGWADAAVIIPWAIYRAYGDERVLAEQYESMAKWVEFARKQAGDDFIWTGGFHFGDWLDFGSSSRGNMGATPTELLATAFFAHSTEILRDAARILGKAEDAARYDTLLYNTRKAFAEKFVKEDGSVTSDTQTAYALALQFNLVPEALRQKVAQKLVQDVRTRGHLTTGFLGTPHLTHALSRFGYLADAYRLLLREQFPSWLYPVKQGATTIWERWDGIKPDGSFQDAGMNSFNHYAYGAIGDWMYRVTAGLEMDATVPGYKRILVQPQPGGGLTWVKARHASLYGDVRSAWRLRGGRFELEVEVPANARALVRLPKASRTQVTESGEALAVGNGMSAVRQEGDTTAVEVGSGVYRFSYPMGK